MISVRYRQLLAEDWESPFLALMVLLLWCLSLGLLLVPLESLAGWAIAPFVLLRTFLHTGLFIMAHDAMHGTLIRGSRRGNAIAGQLFLFLYGLLSFELSAQKHFFHHKAPGTAQDPDFYPQGNPNPLLWYIRFLSQYYSWFRFVAFVLGWTVINFFLAWLTPFTELNFILFYAIPLLLSSAQLFVFGTYLPHRHHDRLTAPGVSGADGPSAGICTLNYPVWLSFLACYHFGYHREHHRYPSVAWFRLPAYRSQRAHAVESIAYTEVRVCHETSG